MARKPWEQYGGGSSQEAPKPWQSYGSSQPSKPSWMESFLSGAGDAATFGFGDEILGFLRGGFDDEARDRYTWESRDQQAAAREADPWAYGGGQVAGALGSGFGVGGLAKAGLQGLGLAATAASAASKAGPLSRIFAAAGTGALGGGIYGAGSANGDDVLGSAAEGAAWGATTGGILRGLGEVGGHVWRGVKPSFSPQARAANEIGKLQERFGQSPQDLAKALNKAAPGSTVMDVIPGGVQLARDAGVRPSAAREEMRAFFDDRNKGMADKATKDLWRTFGKGRSKEWNAAASIDDLSQQKAAMAKPLYDAVEAKTIAAPSPEAMKFVEMHSQNGQWFKPAIDRTVMAITGKTSGASPQELRALMGTGVFWRRLMEETNSEWATLKKAQNMTPLGAPRGTQWREISEQRDALSKVLRQKDMLGKEFADAQDIWSGASKAEDAIEFGYKAVNAEGDLNVGKVLSELKRMSPGEREHAQFAAIAALVDKMDRVPDLTGRADVLRTIIGTKSKRVTLNHLFGGVTTKSGDISSASAIGRLMNRMEKQHQLFRNSVDAGIGVNSHTADRMLGAASLAERTKPTAGGIKDALVKMITGEARDRYDEQVSNEILRLLATPSTAAKAEIKAAGGLDQWLKSKQLLAQAARVQQQLSGFRQKELPNALLTGLYANVGFADPLGGVSGL